MRQQGKLGVFHYLSWLYSMFSNMQTTPRSRTTNHTTHALATTISHFPYSSLFSVLFLFVLTRTKNPESNTRCSSLVGVGVGLAVLSTLWCRVRCRHLLIDRSATKISW